MNFLKNLFYFKKTGIGFTVLFFATPLLMTMSGETGMVPVWITFGATFLFFYGIPVNFFANNSKKNALLKNNLGLRLVEEVSRLNEDEYEEWNEKNPAEEGVCCHCRQEGHLVKEIIPSVSCCGWYIFMRKKR